MRYLLLALMLISSPAWGADHWVYIRTYDRFADTVERGIEKSKAGDVIDIRLADYTPSEKEQSEWLIVKVSGLTDSDIEDVLDYYKEQTGIVDKGDESWATFRKLAFRKRRIDFSSIQNKVGIYKNTITRSQIVNYIKNKTALDIAYYNAGSAVYALLSPARSISNFIVKPAYAATNVSKINMSTQDYDTVALWEDATDNDLVASTTIEEGDVYNDDGILNSNNVVIGGATTNSSYYRILTAPSGERHNGTSATGAVIGRGASSSFSINESYFKLSWLIWYWVGTSSYNALSLGNYTGINVDHMIFQKNADSGNYLNVIGVAGTSPIISNNILIYNKSGFSANHAVAIEASSTTNAEIYNNTLYLSDTGIQGSSSTIAKNNISVSASAQCYSGSFSSSSTNNLSSDNTAPAYSPYYRSKTVSFVNSGSYDLHLSSSDTEAVNKGTTLSSPYDYDIDNYQRLCTWDLGADEIDETCSVATGGPSILRNSIIRNSIIR